MTFDLSTLAKKDTSEIHLTHPATDELLYDSKGNAVKIVVYGTSSPQYRKKALEMSNARIKRGKQKVTAEKLEADGIELLVACSEKALNMVFEGKPIDSPEAFRKLYTAPEFDWLREQVDSFMGDDGSFLEK